MRYRYDKYSELDHIKELEIVSFLKGDRWQKAIKHLVRNYGYSYPAASKYVHSRRIGKE